VATRAAKKAQVLTPQQALAFIERHGIVSESARRGAIRSLVDAIAGETVRGNWWSHARSREIFSMTRAVRDAPQVLVCRIVDGKISFVHERLWPALVRFASRLPQERLARVRETHTSSGKHVIEETPFPDWVPAPAMKLAKRMDDKQADSDLRDFLGALPDT
jgi:hypothetical protein